MTETDTMNQEQNKLANESKHESNEHKGGLLTIFIISVIIVIIFVVLYYFETSNGLMTDLSEKVSNIIL